jgi:hypothetical protein
MHFITWLDYLLLPFFLGVILVVAYNFRNRKYPPGHAWRPYFIPGLMAKLGGALFIGLLYQYYYGGGDTSNYFAQAKVINSSFADSPVKWFNLVFHLAKWYDPEYTPYISQMYWYNSINSYSIGAIAAVLGVVTFNTFLPTSLLFAALAFTGSWAMFRTFATQYPRLARHIAIVILFIPSTFIWGSGIFKDTVCMFALGWLLFGVYRLLLRGKFSLVNIGMAMLSFYLLAIVKLYILVAFVPALLFWIFFSYSARISSGFLRLLSGAALIGVCSGGVVLLSGSLAKELGQYSVENVVKTSTVTREYIYSVSGDEGSGYDLGAVEPTLGGMLRKFPQAVNVALFRPYLWEARKPIVFLNALEAFLFLFVTLKILFAVGPRLAFKAIATDPNIQFCLIFSLIFAFSVGISSGNFGALSRYRIPCLPLYGLALSLIYFNYKPTDKTILGV